MKKHVFYGPALLSALWVLVFCASDLRAPMESSWWRFFVAYDGASPWSLVTTTYFHASLSHLLSNICLAFALTTMFKETLNARSHVSVWLCAAPISALASFMVNQGGLVGASGGLTGILGTAVAIASFAQPKTLKRLLTFGLASFVVIVLPGDIVAHLSGFLVGLIFGPILCRSQNLFHYLLVISLLFWGGRLMVASINLL